MGGAKAGTRATGAASTDARGPPPTGTTTSSEPPKAWAGRPAPPTIPAATSASPVVQAAVARPIPPPLIAAPSPPIVTNRSNPTAPPGRCRRDQPRGNALKLCSAWDWGQRRGPGSASAALEPGRSLLGEGPGALLGVVRREDGPADLELDLQGLVLGQALGGPDRAFDGLHRQRPVLTDDLGDAHGLLQGRPVGDHPAHQPHPQRLLGGDGPGRQQQVHGHGEGDLAGQAHGRSSQGEQPPPGLEDAEGGALGRDADVGRLEQLGSSRHRVALHGRDEGLAQVVVTKQRLPVEIRVGLHAVGVGVLLPLAANGLEVHARAERAPRTRQHRTADLVVAVDHGPGVGHAHEHGRAERVLRLGPVHGHHDGRAAAVHPEVLGPRHRASRTHFSFSPQQDVVAALPRQVRTCSNTRRWSTTWPISSSTQSTASPDASTWLPGRSAGPTGRWRREPTGWPTTWPPRASDPGTTSAYTPTTRWNGSRPSGPSSRSAPSG